MRRRPVGYATGPDRHLPQLPWHATGQEDKAGLLAAAAALLNPIRWPEPFGMVMVEALACGTPVLAHPEGAAPEIVLDGTTGALSDDEDGLAEALAAATTGACRERAATAFGLAASPRTMWPCTGRSLRRRRSGLSLVPGRSPADPAGITHARHLPAGRKADHVDPPVRADDEVDPDAGEGHPGQPQRSHPADGGRRCRTCAKASGRRPTGCEPP